MRARPGYSIIEIIVIVAVFLVFAIVVTPRFSAAGDDAVRTAVLEQLKAIDQRVAAHRADHEDALPELGGEPFSGWAPLVEGGYLEEPPVNAYVLRARVDATEAPPKMLKPDQGVQSAAVGWFYHPVRGVVIANGFDHTSKVFHTHEAYKPYELGW